MSYRRTMASPGHWVSLISRGIQFGFSDFTRGMPRSKRIITWVAILVQAYAIYVLVTRSFVWPIMWPRPWVVFTAGITVFYAAYSVMNGLLASELVRKTQLETDQMAARKIQRTLIPQELDLLPGYHIETYYQPFRDVGGDYFDVIALSRTHALIALADVCGKGMAAALLSANIQALVRSISSSGAEPLALAKQINRHLCQHTPPDVFATAIFLLVNTNSGELAYVNAGHNAPIVFGPGLFKKLQATGLPLGLFSEAEYEPGTETLRVEDSLLLFTDGLTDSIAGDNSEARIHASLQGETEISKAMGKLRSLVDPRFNYDDVTILLVKRLRSAPTGPAGFQGQPGGSVD